MSVVHSEVPIVKSTIKMHSGVDTDTPTIQHSSTSPTIIQEAYGLDDADKTSNQSSDAMPSRNPTKSSFETLCKAAKDILDGSSPGEFGCYAKQGYGLMDVTEIDNAYILYIDCPGMDKKDIDISVDGNRMIVTGNRTIEPVDEGMFYYSERSDNTLNREILLPPGTNANAVSSCYTDGVIIITIEKEDNDRNKVIKRIPVV